MAIVKVIVIGSVMGVEVGGPCVEVGVEGSEVEVGGAEVGPVLTISSASMVWFKIVLSSKLVENKAVFPSGL